MIRYVRASNKFQEYLSGVWTDKVISLAGGGTGAATAADARTNFGLGTMAVQNANAVNVTGGTISGLSSFQVAGSITMGGQLIAGSGPVTLTHANGKIQAITATYFQSLDGSALTGFTASQIPSLDTSKITTGVFGHARLGSGGGGSSKFLREDGTWQEATVIRSITKIVNVLPVSPSNYTISPSLTDYTKAVVLASGQVSMTFNITSNSNLQVTGNASGTPDFVCYIVEYR